MKNIRVKPLGRSVKRKFQGGGFSYGDRDWET